MRPSVVTFAQLPEEHHIFLQYLASTGDVWARPEMDASFAPAPVIDFMTKHHEALFEKGSCKLYLGMRLDVLQPPIDNRNGFETINIFAACLLHYSQGGYYESGELAQSNLYFYRGFFQEDAELVIKPLHFTQWASKILGWVKRRTPETAPVFRCNYHTRATVRVAEACRSGLKVWY